MVCIRTLVIGSTHTDANVGEEGLEVLPYDSDSSGGKSSTTSISSSVTEYNQVLIRQVEEKLTLFLEEQVRSTRNIIIRDDNDDPSSKSSINDDKIVLPIHKAHAYPCRDTHKTLPSPPKDWPQR
jgi:hypothetical protein